MKLAHALLLCKLFIAYQFLNYWKNKSGATNHVCLKNQLVISTQLQALIPNANYIK